MYRSGGSSGRAGVGILIHKRLKNNIVSYKFYSERIISIRLAINLRRDSRTVTVVCCYAPTLQRSTKYPPEADSFYSVLSSIAGQVKRRDELWILGDFNAKVGSSVGGRSGPVGSYSKHTSNNANGDRLLDLCGEHGLVLCNTLFKHKLQHLSTWFADGLTYSDGRAVRNMIDFIAVKTGGLTSVTNARSYGGFRTRSDHHPVIADFRLSFRPAKPAPKSKGRCFSKYNQPTEITRKLSQSALLENLPEIQLSQVSPLY